MKWLFHAHGPKKNKAQKVSLAARLTQKSSFHILAKSIYQQFEKLANLQMFSRPPIAGTLIYISAIKQLVRMKFTQK
ncbi:TPA: hypothetical protein ACN969_003703 [Acinetobacter baumannii]|uniref:hypothetical protein n=1 Tax=Acinetobacter towneri TaxID=202956 RepID=UPI0035906AA1